MSIYDQQPVDTTQPIPESEVIVNSDVFEKDSQFGQVGNFKKLKVGAGSTTFEINKEGMFLGATNYTDARYSQDFSGKIQIRDSNGNVVILIDPNG